MKIKKIKQSDFISEEDGERFVDPVKLTKLLNLILEVATINLETTHEPVKRNVN